MNALTTFSLTAMAIIVTGCAAPKPLNGAVMPSADGSFQSVVKARDKADALKLFDADARATCKSPQQYAVIKQDFADNTPAAIKTSSGIANAAIAIAAGKTARREQYFEATTAFRCM